MKSKKINLLKKNPIEIYFSCKRRPKEIKYPLGIISNYYTNTSEGSRRTGGADTHDPGGRGGCGVAARWQRRGRPGRLAKAARGGRRRQGRPHPRHAGYHEVHKQARFRSGKPGRDPCERARKYTNYAWGTRLLNNRTRSPLEPRPLYEGLHPRIQQLMLSSFSFSGWVESFE